MGTPAGQTFTQGEELLRARQYEAALQHFVGVVGAAPDFWPARYRVADGLLSLGDKPAALEVYQALAWHAVKSGAPLAGISALKMAALLDRAHQAGIEIIAELYGADSDRLVQATPAPGTVAQPDDHAALTQPTEPDPATGAPLRQRALALAVDFGPCAPYPESLPAIPLLSLLRTDAFAAVLALAKLRRFERGQVVVAEGAQGESFFVLAHGDVDVTRRHGERTLRVARLHAGSVFGEMALVSQAPRAATVTAVTDCDVLELGRTDLEREGDRLHTIVEALHAFTRERFLANLTATNPVFRPFPRAMRADIIKRFKEVRVDAGDEIIAEGEPGEGLYLLLRGSVEVSKRDGDRRVALAKLREGDVFGEIALILEQPTTATCVALTESELLYLPRRDFSVLTSRHPELRAELLKLSDERLRHTQELLDPDLVELVEDDELVML